jgi:hypothetical protein
MGTAMTVREEPAAVTVAPRVGLLRPIAAPQDVIRAQEEVRALVADALQEGRDYGTIPGTNKPSLLKAGAERVSLAFGCYFGAPEIIEKEIDHDRENSYTRSWWESGTKREAPAISYGLYRYVVRVPVIHRETGAVVGMGIGACSTMESKYVSRPRDCENTALKMAHKRAIVGGALVTFGLSDQFTQDVEDIPREALAGDGAPPSAGRAAAAKPAAAGPVPNCPTCAGLMWDNRAKKASGEFAPNRPDFSCRDKACKGAVWPPREKKAAPRATATVATAPAGFSDEAPLSDEDVPSWGDAEVTP